MTEDERKAARREKSRRFYAANRERLNAQLRERRENDPEFAEARRQRSSEWQKANREQATRNAANWRAENPEQARAAVRRFTQKQRAVLVAAKAKPCADCGVQYPSYVMQFDHRDPSVKDFTIAHKGPGKNIEILLAEIAKCDVVCANCHAERTFGDRFLQREVG